MATCNTIITSALLLAIAVATISLVEAATVDTKIEVIQVRSPIGIRRSSFSFTPNGTQGQPNRIVSSHNDIYSKGWLPTKATTKIGFNQGFCVETYYNFYFECFFTFGLPGGALTVQGPYSLDYKQTTLLVNGGRGIYETYRGTVTLTPNVPTGHFTWSFNLISTSG